MRVQQQQHSNHSSETQCCAQTLTHDTTSAFLLLTKNSTRLPKPFLILQERSSILQLQHSSSDPNNICQHTELATATDTVLETVQQQSAAAVCTACCILEPKSQRGTARNGPFMQSYSALQRPHPIESSLSCRVMVLLLFVLNRGLADCGLPVSGVHTSTAIDGCLSTV
eukprot:6393-Heterococcus_DN1.PRE.6